MTNTDIIFMSAIQREMTARGLEKDCARWISDGFSDTVTPELASFIAEPDTVFLATATASGTSYIQPQGRYRTG